MTLDRAEVALRLACASASNFHGAPLPPKEFAASILSYADALLLALTPPVSPAPVAPKSEAAKWVPRVGDVVHRLPRTSTDGTGGVVYSTTDASQGRPIKIVGVGRNFGWSVACAADEVTYLRPATPAERKAAGIVEPSPEATRPTLPVCAWPGCAALSDPRWYVYDMLGGRWPSCDGHGGKSLPVHPPAPVEPAKGEAGRAEEYWRTHREGGGTDTDLRRFVQGWVARAATGGS